MLEQLRTRSRDESGFTLIELLVVMLILGILATIAIPAFFSQRDKAKDSDAKATVNSAATAIESHSTNNGGVYTGATVALLQGIEPTLPDATKLTVTPTATGKGYTVTVKSTTNNTFSINRSDTGLLTYTCTVTGGNVSAGCPTSLNWKT